METRVLLHDDRASRNFINNTGFSGNNFHSEILYWNKITSNCVNHDNDDVRQRCSWNRIRDVPVQWMNISHALHHILDTSKGTTIETRKCTQREENGYHRFAFVKNVLQKWVTKYTDENELKRNTWNRHMINIFYLDKCVIQIFPINNSCPFLHPDKRLSEKP